MKRLLLRWLVIAYNVPLLAQGEVLSRELEMVTTQVALDSKSTCGTAMCVVSLNTNRIASHLEVLPRAISKIRKIRV